jgi:hypothetical protein
VGERGVDHTGQLRHYPLASLVAIVLKLVGQHLNLNIILKNFTVETRRKVWCDRGMREACTYYFSRLTSDGRSECGWVRIKDQTF